MLRRLGQVARRRSVGGWYGRLRGLCGSRGVFELQEDIVDRQKDLIGQTTRALEMLDLSDEHRRLLERTAWHLDELFLIVVVGEFNSGKSMLINTLVGQQVCDVGVTPTTSHIHVIRHSEHDRTPRSIRQRAHEVSALRVDAIQSQAADIDWLKHANIVDTPGTNAFVEGHQSITEEFLPRADLVLFVTSVDRPFSDSESRFMKQIADWKKKIVLVLNKVDTLEESTDKVLEFVRASARHILHDYEPTIYPISARRAKDRSNTDELAASGIPELEQFIAKTLSDREQLQLKLLNPLGIVDRLVSQYDTQRLKPRRDTLAHDKRLLTEVKQQLSHFEQDMQSDFQFQLAEVENIVLRLQDRCDQFIDEEVRLSKALRHFTSRNAELQHTFETKVVRDFVSELQDQSSSLMSWLMDKSNAKAQETSQKVASRVPDTAPTSVSFLSSRQDAIRKLQEATRRLCADFDERHESSMLVSTFTSGLWSTLALEASALGLGVGALYSAAAVDLTGATAVGLLAFTGLNIFPYKRRSLRQQLRRKLDGVRSQLKQETAIQFERELRSAVQSIHGAVAPFERTVTQQTETVDTAQTKIDGIADEVHRIRDMIDALQSK